MKEFMYEKKLLCPSGYWLEFCRTHLSMEPDEFCKAIEFTEVEYRDTLTGKAELSDKRGSAVYHLIAKAHWEKLKDEEEDK